MCGEASGRRLPCWPARSSPAQPAGQLTWVSSANEMGRSAIVFVVGSKPVDDSQLETTAPANPGPLPKGSTAINFGAAQG